MRPIGIAGGLLLLVTGATDAQMVRFRLDAIGLTYQEIDEDRGASVGQGLGAGLEFRLGRFRLDARGYGAHVDPPRDTQVGYDFRQVDVRVGYFLTEFLALEVGGGRRYVEPDFAAPEVGVLRVGVFSENQLHRLANVWVRGAYLADPRFSTGGTASLAFEFSLGVGLGSSTGRFRIQAEYEFQRIDRVVQNVDVPLQLNLARAGVAVAF